MIPFRRILFPVDFSEPCRSMAPYVGVTTAHFAAELTLVHALQLPSYNAGEMGIGTPVEPIPVDELQSSLERWLHQFAAEVLPGSPVRAVVRRGDPVSVIHDMVAREGFDLVMMPTRGRGVFRRLLLGSVTAKLLHNVSCAVWTGAHTDSDQPGEPRTILCAVDLDEEAPSVVRAAGALAASYGGSLVVMHAVQDIGGMGYELEPDAYRKQFKTRARERLRALMKEAAPEAKMVIVEGAPAKAIRKQAMARHADLIVAGRGHSQGVLPALRTGLPAIIREAPCPVLSI